MIQTLADLRGVGVDIVTIGQYLRPTSNHLPVARWWTPDELTALKVAGEAMRSEEHTSELQSLMRISYAVFCLKKKNTNSRTTILTLLHIVKIVRSSLSKSNNIN